MSKWIPVMEQCPEPLADVLIAYRNFAGELSLDVGFMLADGQWQYLGIDGLLISNPVYWMQFPEPPTVEVEG
jgi:hypothetical protein